MAWYTYAHTALFDPNTQRLAPAGSEGQLYAVSDTGFTDPLPAFDLTGIPVALIANEVGFIPDFQVEGHVEVLWKSGEYVFHLTTTTPLIGPTGAAVASADVSGDVLTFGLSDGTTLPPVTLPTGPGGSDEGVAGYIDSPDSATAAALARALPGAVAKDPGASDDTVSLNALLAANAGKAVTLKAGSVYRITDTLFIPSGTRLDGNGATIDAGGTRDTNGVRTGGIPDGALGERWAIKAVGSRATTVTITNAITKGATVLTGLSTTGTIAAGDLLLLRNEEQPLPGMTRGDRDKGELVTVKSVDAATKTVTLAAGTTFAYGTNGLVLNTLNIVDDVRIRNLTLVCGGAGSSHNGIQVQYGRNIAIENVSITGAEDMAINLRTVRNGTVNRCTLKDSTSPAAGTSGYGVAIMDGSQGVRVTGNYFENCRHFVAGGGFWPTILVDVEGNTGTRSISSAYDTHESCWYWKFSRNTVSNAHGGFIARGQHITFENNEVIGSTNWGFQAMVFDGVTEQRGIRFLNNKVVGSTVGGFQVDGSGDNSRKIDIELSGNTSEGGPYGIFARNFDRMTIRNNIVSGTSDHGIVALGISAANKSAQLTLNNNTVSAAAKDGYLVRDVDDASLSGGQLLNTGSYGAELVRLARATVSGLTIRGTGWGGILLTDSTQSAFTGLNISGGISASYDAFRATGSTDLTINGGTYASPRNAIYTTTTDYVIVTGVNARNSTGTKIAVDATNKQVANNLV